MNSITPEEMQKIQADREKAEQVYQAMNQATEYYYNKLLGNPEAMAYLKGRGLTEDFIRSNPYVKFGYAPLNQNDLCNYLVSRFGEDVTIATGIFRKNKYGKLYPTTKIWIKELKKEIAVITYGYVIGGHVQYIIGRRFTAPMPGETSDHRFAKLKLNNGKDVTIVKNEIFGVDSLSLVNQNFNKSILIAEGLFDAILPIQNGIPTISPVTTRFAAHQIEDMCRIAKRFTTIYIVPDPDAAGESGAVKTAKQLFKDGKTVKIVTLPKVEGVKKFDLADYFLSHTADNFFELCKQGMSLADFLLQTIPQDTQKTELKNILDKKEVITLISRMDAVNREHYQKLLSQRFSLEINTVRDLFKEETSTMEIEKVKSEAVKVQDNKNIKPLSFTDIINIKGDIQENAIVPGLFYRDSISIIFGEPGSGKTWLASDIIFNIAEGNLIWGKYKTVPHKVLLLEGDFSNLVLKDRMKNFSLHDKNAENFNVMTTEEMDKNNYEYCLDKHEGQKNIEYLIEITKPAMVVIDSLGSFMSCDESKPDGVKSIINFLKEMVQKFHIHILIIHHSRKRTSLEKRERKLDQSDMIGSSLLMRYASTIFSVNTLHDDEEKLVNKGLVVNSKNWFRTLPSFEYEITDSENGGIELKYNHENLSTAKTKKQTAYTAILKLLSADPSMELSQEQIVQATNIGQRMVKDVVQELVRDEKITGIGESRNRKYRIKYISDIYVPDTIKQCPNNGKTYIYQ